MRTRRRVNYNRAARRGSLRKFPFRRSFRAMRRKLSFKTPSRFKFGRRR